jgi:hypothetical protein
MDLARYLPFFATASIFDTALAPAAILGCLGCFGLRTSRPPLFFDIVAPIAAVDPVVLQAAEFDDTQTLRRLGAQHSELASQFSRPRRRRSRRLFGRVG